MEGYEEGRGRGKENNQEKGERDIGRAKRQRRNEEEGKGRETEGGKEER